MKKAIVFIFLLTTVFILSFWYEKGRINSLEEVLNARNDTIEDLKNQNKELTKKLKELKKDSNNEKASKLAEETYDLQKQVSELEDQNNSLKEKVSELTAANTEKTSPMNYLKIKFWNDGKNYKLSDDNLRVYKNQYLSKEFSDTFTVVSPTISEDVLENGQTVFSFMTTKGIAYTSFYPNLEELTGNSKAPEKAFSSKANDKYIQMKFWSSAERKTLHEDSNQSWYDDCYLTKKLDNSRIIISERIDSFKMSNNITIWAALDSNNNIVWMSEEPALQTVE